MVTATITSSATLTATVTATITATQTVTPAIQAGRILAVWAGADDDPLADGVQVSPQVGAIRQFEAWAVVDGPTVGADANNWNPQMSGALTRGAEAQANAVVLEPVTDPATISSALSGAQAAGLIGKAEADAVRDSLAMYATKVYRAKVALPSTQPPGEYGVDFSLTGKDGREAGRKSLKFRCMEIAAVELDFQTVDFGSVPLGVAAQVLGDDRFSQNDKRPTIRNAGNVPIQVDLDLNPLENKPDKGPKTRLEGFWVGFLGEKLKWSKPGDKLVFSGLLQPSMATAVDFWLDVPVNAPVGTYIGNIRVRASVPPESK